MNRSILFLLTLLLVWMSGGGFARAAASGSISPETSDEAMYLTAADQAETDPATSTDAPPKPFYMQGDETIVFYGDSITQAGLYIEYIEAFLATRFPQTNFKIINHGISSETISGTSEPGHQPRRPDAKVRFDRDIVACKPDVVVACFGMNDGNYFPPDEERFEAYRTGIRWLKDQTDEKTDARLTLLTPPPFDPYQRRNSDPEAATFGYQYPSVDYDKTLSMYAEYLMSIADDRLTVSDLHTAMNEHLAARRAEKVSFLLSPDAIHPNPTGHWLMAMHLLLSWHAPSECDSIDIDMTGTTPVIKTLSPQPLQVKPASEATIPPDGATPASEPKSTGNATASDSTSPSTSSRPTAPAQSVSPDNKDNHPTADTALNGIPHALTTSETTPPKEPIAKVLDSGDLGIKFSWRPRLPMPTDSRWDMQSILLENVSRRLNRHRIAIHGFDPVAEYIMFVDTESESKPVAKIKGAALDRGIDLTLIPEFPTTKRSNEVLELIRKKSKLEYTAWRNSIAETPPTGSGDKEASTEDTKAEIESLGKQIKALCQPAEITIRIVKGFTAPEQP